MKSIFKIVLVAAAVVLLNGCGAKYKNGAEVPKENEIKANGEIKVYLDNTATLNREKLVMEEIVKVFKEGIPSKNAYEIIEGEKIAKKDFNINNELFDANNKVLELGITSFNQNNVNKLVNKLMIKSKESHIESFNFKKEDRKLVLDKSYDNYEKLAVDMYILAVMNKNEKIIKLKQELGFTKFFIDGKELIDNKKIVLVPITKVYPFKEKMEDHLKIKGFQIVDKKEDADEVVYLETLAFMKSKYLKGFKYNSQIARVGADTQTPQLAMSMNSFTGGSSGASAALGGALFLLNFLGSESESYKFIFTARKTHNNKVIFTSFKPLKVSPFIKLHESFAKTVDNNKRDIFSRYSGAIASIIHKGKSNYGNDKSVEVK